MKSIISISLIITAAIVIMIFLTKEQRNKVFQSGRKIFLPFLVVITALFVLLVILSTSTFKVF